ncbi:hypothetical protein [Streptomyces sp. NPDC059928]|uniref:hypothetical protein n=1 Tax=unclassified Streptomyces TaxID=2593676 RepID=UPI0036480DA6
MRAFPVVMPSGQKYWTVLDDDLEIVPVADHWLRNLRFGRDRAELTTKAYAGGVALYLRWCGATGRSWPDAGRDLGLFMVWLKYTPAPRDGIAVVVRPGPGAAPVRCERRINRVLVAVGDCCRTRCPRARRRAGCWGRSTSSPTAGISRWRRRVKKAACSTGCVPRTG